MRAREGRKIVEDPPQDIGWPIEAAHQHCMLKTRQFLIFILKAR